jgi:CrcB protein
MRGTPFRRQNDSTQPNFVANITCPLALDRIMRTLVHMGWVFLGGGIGSALRYGVGRAGLALAGPNFPLATMIVNLLGCTLMGMQVEWLAWRDTGIDASVKLFLATGLLGGFTTFSAFALDAVALWQRGAILTAVAYGAGSVALSIAGFLAGMALMRAFVAP